MPLAQADESLARTLSRLPLDERQAFLEGLTDAEAEALFYDWDFWARPSQREPDGDWFLWFLRGGRGASKTRVGAEFSKRRCLALPDQRWALVAETFADGRDTMVEGESGMLSILPWRALRGGNQDDAWNRSLGELFLANGSRLKIYSSEKPGQLRGPQHHGAWGDEPAKWHDAYLGDGEDTTWSNLLLGLRLGAKPQVVLTGTPKPVKLLVGTPERPGLLKDPSPKFIVTVMSTYENLENLSPVFRDVVIPRYEGTTLGRQELHAELIEAVEGAIFDYDIIARYRSEPPVLERLSIGVDPATTAEKTSDECGIVVGGVATVDTPETPLEGLEVPDRSHLLRHAWVLQDASGRMAVDVWASRAVDLAITWGAGRIVAEVNNGGDLVLSNIKAECEKRGGRATKVRRHRPDGTESGWDWAIELPDGSAFVVAGVWAKDSKALRAEPQSIRYRQGRVHHADIFVELEAEQTTWVPGQESPNRLDALVWMLTDLLGMEVRKRARLRFRE
jgi:phage terminase large subunit-like protein